MGQRIITPLDLHSLNDVVMNYWLKWFLSDDAQGSNETILFDVNFKPDTFTVYERIAGNAKYLSDSEQDGAKWIRSILINKIERIAEEYGLEFHDEVVEFCYTQVMKFLYYEINGEPVASLLTNQEFPDTVSKLLAYIITGDPKKELHVHRTFNEIGWKLIPPMIEDLLRRDISLKDLLCYCIASGLIGLDLKGSFAAASDLATIAIPLRPFWGSDVVNLGNVVLTAMEKIVSGGLAVDHWNDFYGEVIERPCKLLWFMDDYIESLFDLTFIHRLMTSNPLLTVVVVPKRGRYVNDMAYDDLLDAIDLLPLFTELRDHISNRRLIVSPYGPSMATVNLRKLSQEVVADIQSSDYVFVKGCRSHELIQGGLNKTTYTAYVVAREFSETETGFDARLSPLLFFRSAPGEYAYWGFKGRFKRARTFPDGRTIRICYSTLEEHEKRKKILDPREVIAEIKQLTAIQQDVIRDGYTSSYRREIHPLVEKLVTITRDSYDLVADRYRVVRYEQPHQVDVELFDELLSLARALVREGKLGNQQGKIALLDVGTGPGRDLRYFRRFSDVEAFGIDNCDAFIRILSELADRGEIPKNSFAKMDMRDLSGFEDATFDVVRHNATLLHLPMIAEGVGVDEAISESYRVLKPFGIMFINVKKGEGMEFVDTGEGLGGRFFQYFSEQSLVGLLKRNKFAIIRVSNWHEDRPSGRVEWLAVYAQKMV